MEQIVIHDRIEFETGKDKLLNESLPVLDVVVNLLNQKPHIELVEIHGHTDDIGDDMRNIRLSEARAPPTSVCCACHRRCRRCDRGSPPIQCAVFD